MNDRIENSEYAADVILTEEIARAFLEDPDSQDLDKFLAIDDAAAETLSKHKGSLVLEGLTSLSDAAAEALSKHQGLLILQGLTSLSDCPGHTALAKKLSKQEGRNLGLDSLRSISDAAAEELINHRGTLAIGLTSISDAVAEIFRKKDYGGEGLYILDLKSISETGAYSLWNITHIDDFLGPDELDYFRLGERDLIATSDPDIINPDEFDISGLSSIDLEQARVIARQPWYVNLSGLETLDVKTAEVLAGHKGTICLTGLRQLSIQAAEAIAKHEGPVLLDRDQLPAEILYILEPICQ